MVFSIGTIIDDLLDVLRDGLLHSQSLTEGHDGRIPLVFLVDGFL